MRRYHVIKIPKEKKMVRGTNKLTKVSATESDRNKESERERGEGEGKKREERE